MGTIGQVESLWRYPVKSMRGQEIAEAFLGKVSLRRFARELPVLMETLAKISAY